MQNELLITKRDDKILSLHREGGRIVQIQAQSQEEETVLGNIYVGKVRNIVKNINAAFVEFKKGKMGYLSLSEKTIPVHTDGFKWQEGRVLIGDEIMVQVAREAVKTKPPTLTGALDFTGRYVVLTTGNSQISVSHKIRNKEQRELLQKLLASYVTENYGFIARTNAANVAEELVTAEIERLISQYENLMQYGVHKTMFTCLKKAPQGYLCDLRDGYGSLVDSIVTDEDDLYENIKSYLQENQAEDCNKLTLWNPENGKLDAVYNVSRTLDHALMPKVWLKSGAYLVIQPTEALVSIDVNTGKAISKKKDVQKTFLKVNLEAAREIALQMRLRNLSGMIVIDFIDMKSKEDNELVMDELRKAFAPDPIRSIVVDMTALGLVEVTRKKVRKSLFEQMKGN